MHRHFSPVHVNFRHKLTSLTDCTCKKKQQKTQWTLTCSSLAVSWDSRFKRRYPHSSNNIILSVSSLFTFESHTRDGESMTTLDELIYFKPRRIHEIYDSRANDAIADSAVYEIAGEILIWPIGKLGKDLLTQIACAPIAPFCSRPFSRSESRLN